MISIGVTGGIGSGKTSLCREFEKLDACVVYADNLARELMISDDSVKQNIIRSFGSSAYTTTGDLNKNHLVSEAFDKGRVDELNDIVHPAVKKTLIQLRDSARDRGCKLFVYEAALLLANGRPDYLDKIVWVEVRKQLRVDRVVSRDGSTQEDVLARMNYQQTFDEVKPYIDYIVFNDGSMEELMVKAHELYQTLTR